MRIGVLRMPMDDASPLDVLQYVARGRQAADRIEADAAEIAALRAEVVGMRKFAGDMRYWHHEYMEGLISAETLSTYVGMVIGEYDAAARKGEA